MCWYKEKRDSLADSARGTRRIWDALLFLAVSLCVSLCLFGCVSVSVCLCVCMESSIPVRECVYVVDAGAHVVTFPG